MLCQQCGNPVEGAFCSRCGAPVQPPPPSANPATPPNPPIVPPVYGAPPPMYPPPVYIQRVPQHLQTLGILWCVYGAYRAVSGLFAALFLMGMSVPGFFGRWGIGHGTPFPFVPFMPHFPFLGAIAGFIAVIVFVMAALSFLVGFSLLSRKPWGRVLAIVMAILALIKLPFGTALGIYTLWVLASGPSGAEYDAIARRG